MRDRLPVPAPISFLSGNNRFIVLVSLKQIWRKTYIGFAVTIEINLGRKKFSRVEIDYSRQVPGKLNITG